MHLRMRQRIGLAQGRARQAENERRRERGDEADAEPAQVNWTFGASLAAPSVSK